MTLASVTGVYAALNAAIIVAVAGLILIEALTRGLPQQNALELVLRDGLDVDGLNPAGVYFGTRSGSVWGSADGGASWSEIASGLPPVICVKTAFVGGAAWSFSDNGDFAFHLDYIWHQYDWISVDKGRLPVYFGIGGRMKLNDGGDDLVGARIPIGLNYHFADAPVDAFVEVVPILDLAPATEFRMNAALGARFFF